MTLKLIICICKKLLSVKQPTQNDFVHGELGGRDFQSRRYINIIKYYLTVITSDVNKLIKSVYNIMLNDIETHPHKENGHLQFLGMVSTRGRK